jgi:hypothetical protein
VGRLLTLVTGDGEGAEEVEEGAELVKVGCPLTVLPLADKKAKVLLEFLIDTFRLSISLRVVGCSSCDLDT